MGRQPRTQAHRPMDQGSRRVARRRLYSSAAGRLRGHFRPKRRCPFSGWGAFRHHHLLSAGPASGGPAIIRRIIMGDPVTAATPRYLKTPDAAIHLGLSARTLEKHRCFGTGPVFRKLGGRIVYAIDDLDAWAALGTRRSTS